MFLKLSRNPVWMTTSTKRMSYCCLTSLANIYDICMENYQVKNPKTKRSLNTPTSSVFNLYYVSYPSVKKVKSNDDYTLLKLNHKYYEG